MGDQIMRVWPIEGDTYGDVQEFPRYAKYRMEPQYPGATGDANHDLVIYTVDDSVDQPVGQPRNETELARFHATEVLVAYAGQSMPAPILHQLSQREQGGTPRTNKPKDETSKSKSTTNSK
jgi:hypothetical protein